MYIEQYLISFQLQRDNADKLFNLDVTCVNFVILLKKATNILREVPVSSRHYVRKRDYKETKTS